MKACSIEEALHLATIVTDLLTACNLMCLLLSGWDQHAEALEFLADADTGYKLVVAAAKQHPSVADLQNMLPEVDRLYTHSLFYYAQVTHAPPMLSS